MELIVPTALTILLVIAIFGGIVAFVIWLIVYRLREKENETFEKRDN